MAEKEGEMRFLRLEVVVVAILLAVSLFAGTKSARQDVVSQTGEFAPPTALSLGWH